MEGTLRSYIAGFALSVVLTLTAFFVVLNPGSFHFGTAATIVTILVLAIIQLLVQLVFFMHLGVGAKSRWELGILLSTIGIILIIVVGSIWIMAHLNYNMMANPSQMNAYIQSQDGF